MKKIVTDNFGKWDFTPADILEILHCGFYYKGPPYKLYSAYGCIIIVQDFLSVQCNFW